MQTSLTAEPKLTRAQIRRVLRRHRGTIVQLAKQLGITTQTVSCWLRNKTDSQRVADIAHAKALELIREEEKHNAA